MFPHLYLGIPSHSTMSGEGPENCPSARLPGPAASVQREGLLCSLSLTTPTPAKSSTVRMVEGAAPGSGGLGPTLSPQGTPCLQGALHEAVNIWLPCTEEEQLERATWPRAPSALAVGLGFCHDCITIWLCSNLLPSFPAKTVVTHPRQPSRRVCAPRSPT